MTRIKVEYSTITKKSLIMLKLLIKWCTRKLASETAESAFKNLQQYKQCVMIKVQRDTNKHTNKHTISHHHIRARTQPTDLKQVDKIKIRIFQKHYTVWWHNLH